MDTAPQTLEITQDAPAVFHAASCSGSSDRRKESPDRKLRDAASEAAMAVPVDQIEDAIKWTESYLATLKIRTLAYLQRLVGQVGEFTSASGAVCKCVVTGYDSDPPFDDECLIIDYIHANGSKVQGAMIPVALFREDSSPNAATHARGAFGVTNLPNLTPTAKMDNNDTWESAKGGLTPEVKSRILKGATVNGITNNQSTECSGP